jgi:hypothetical protein
MRSAQDEISQLVKNGPADLVVFNPWTPRWHHKLDRRDLWRFLAFHCRILIYKYLVEAVLWEKIPLTLDAISNSKLAVELT